MFDELKETGFEILALHHSEAILRHDMPEAIEEIETVLKSISLPIVELVRGGGGEGQVTQRIRNAFSNDFSWFKHNFVIQKIVDGIETESISHEIDHVKKFTKGTIALEIEWNNKDPFYDRDLENYKRLHADGVISIGVIITRGSSLHQNMKSFIEAFAIKSNIDSIEKLAPYYSPTLRQKGLIEKNVISKGSFAKGWAHAFVSDKFGEATTHWRKLEDRVSRGVGNPCPLLLIGIPKEVVEV
ncbi:MAG: restriction endonuclease [Candidatus Scalindua sp.]|jgi:hypothetical protein|nr:restriction endonuclease [Candidatus Scalindua sp.]